MEQSRQSDTTVPTGKSRDPIASHGVDDPIGADLADAIIEIVCDIEVAGRIYRHTGSDIQRGASSRTTIAGEFEPPVAP